MSRATREPPYVPDELDLMILEHMATDAGVQFKQLAETLKADQRTIAKRVGKMKEIGVLRNKIEINWSRIGRGIAAYVGVETGLGEKDLTKLHDDVSLLRFLRQRWFSHKKSKSNLRP